MLLDCFLSLNCLFNIGLSVAYEKEFVGVKDMVGVSCISGAINHSRCPTQNIKKLNIIVKMSACDAHGRTTS